MNTKKCKKCGWEYPLMWPGRQCRFCQEPFTDGPCSYCGKYAEKLYTGKCKDCNTLLHMTWKHNRISDATRLYEDWLSKIADIPKPSAPLTEEQWLNACKHFGGCAYCGDSNIDARSMFITFKDGGRYCAWNIIPSCERCETLYKLIHNPFLMMDQKLRRGNNEQAKKYGFTLDRLQRIVEYLQSKMEVIK